MLPRLTLRSQYCQFYFSIAKGRFSATPRNQLDTKEDPKTAALKRIWASCGHPPLCDCLPALFCKEVSLEQIRLSQHALLNKSHVAERAEPNSHLLLPRPRPLYSSPHRRNTITIQGGANLHDLCCIRQGEGDNASPMWQLDLLAPIVFVAFIRPNKRQILCSLVQCWDVDPNQSGEETHLIHVDPGQTKRGRFANGNCQMFKVCPIIFSSMFSPRFPPITRGTNKLATIENPQNSHRILN